MLSSHKSVKWAVTAIALVASMMLVSAAAQAQTTWHVDDDNCPGPGSGTMKDPFCSIQDAIDATSGGDEVVVAPGTYFEVINFNAKAITLRSTDPLDPAVVAVTIIDAQQTGTVVTCNSGEGPDTVLDGFTVTGGDGFGGGMRNVGSSPTVTNCTFSGNSADDRGGGMYNLVSSPTVTNCTFSGNMARLGGGLYNLQSSPTVTNCEFTGNTASGNSNGGHGGAIYNTNSSPFVTDCDFDGNAAISTGASDFNARGGAVHNTLSDPIFTRCHFVNNSATGIASNMGRAGGGMYNNGGSPTVTNCMFIGNSAFWRAGGMFNQNSSPTITNCEFTANFTDPMTGSGSGGMGNNNSNPTVEDCTFTGNLATIGGGMENFQSSPRITNCQFIDNIATGGNWGGGGILSSIDSTTTIANCTFSGNMAAGGGGGVSTAYDSITTITNCTFSNNTALAGSTGGGIYTTDAFGGHSETTVVNTIVWDNSPDEIGDAEGATTTVNYSDVQGGWPGAGSNNIDAGPLFVDPVNSDFHLLSGSPGIDAGNNWGVPIDANDYDEDGNTAELFPVDLDGNPRFNADEADFDLGCGLPVVVDMGAYEYQFAPVEEVIFADLNADGAVGILDLLAVLAAWGDARNNCLADLNIDGDVGILDLLTLLANWG